MKKPYLKSWGSFSLHFMNMSLDKLSVLSFICRRPDTVAYMTTPKQMHSNVMEALQYLDSHLPKGSHVILMGLVDGGFLWDHLHNRYHPLGKYEALFLISY